MFRMIARTRLPHAAPALWLVLLTWAIFTACETTASAENEGACRAGETRNTHGECVPITEP